MRVAVGANHSGYLVRAMLIEMISGALLDRQDRDAADEDFELVM